jgi:hypothetical protein
MNPIRSFQELTDHYKDWKQEGWAPNRIFACLLYTTSNSNIGRYVRNHFRELDSLSGECLIFVADRPRGFHDYMFRDYNMRFWDGVGGVEENWWKETTPYDDVEIYGVAEHLGIDRGAIPCLVFFKDLGSREFIVYPLGDGRDESLLTEKLSGLFAAANQTVKSQAGQSSAMTLEESEKRKQLRWEALKSYVKNDQKEYTGTLVILLAANVLELLEKVNRLWI